MQVLELKPLKNKRLKIILVESEFPVDWTYEKINDDVFLENIFFMTKEYMDFIEILVDQYQPEFIIEDKGMRSNNENSEGDDFIQLFKKRGIVYQMVDIPDYALNQLSVPLMDKKELLMKFTQEIEKYKERGQVHYNDPHYQQLIAWKEYLKSDYKNQEDELRFKIRESWMMMGILELTKKFDKKEVISLFICDKRHFDGIVFLADELEIQHEIINIKKVSSDLDDKRTVKDVINSSVLEIMPIKVKKKVKEEKLLYFFDTDDFCSPFDTNMGYDAGFDAVIPYCNMKVDRVTKLVQDAMFSRKVGAPTVYFVGGSDVEESEKIAEEVLKAIVSPFESPIIIDPRGSHTTAAAIVAKTMEIAHKHKINNLKNKKIVILGGTGPVGQICAIIASKLKANVIITSRSEDNAKKMAKKLTKKAGNGATEIIGIQAASEEQYFKVVKDADIIWSVGKAGIQILSKEIMKNIPPDKIVLDINLVPPYGIEGMKPNSNDEEIYKGIYAIGALDIGRLKYTIESTIFKIASVTKGKRIFDYNYAFEIATEKLFGKEIKISI